MLSNMCMSDHVQAVSIKNQNARWMGGRPQKLPVLSPKLSMHLRRKFQIRSLGRFAVGVKKLRGFGGFGDPRDHNLCLGFAAMYRL